MRKKMFDRKIIDCLIMPYFVIQGRGVEEPVAGMPGICRMSADKLLEELDNARMLGLKKALLFGVIPRELKDENAGYAYSEDNIISSAVSQIKDNFKDITVYTDVCLCAYTCHGHCFIMRKDGRRSKARMAVAADSEKTLSALARIALSHAAAGADFVAPSAMAKKQVFAIRKMLDARGYAKTKIMGYSAKFASGFYGPFRDAARSAPAYGDRSSYQLAFNDTVKALQEIKDDIKEGADIVMVKPAIPYLDIIYRARNATGLPLAAFNVSGEYAMVKHGVRTGLWDEKSIVSEIITSIKRAGADLIISYHAKDIAKWVKEQ